MKLPPQADESFARLIIASACYPQSALVLPSAMAPTVFSIPIFFIVFRETLEAAIIVSVLLGLVEQIVHIRSDRLSGQTPSPSSPEENDKKENGFTSTRELAGDEDAVRTRRLVRKMRFQECPTLRIHHIFVTDATV